GGEWRPPSTGEHEPCLNPADTREVIGLWPRSGAADAKAAVDAAAKAFPDWSRTPGPERGRILGRAHQILKAKTHLLAEALGGAGLPPGVINVVTGPGGAIGNALVDDPRIRAVSFTGSNSVGLKLYERAARRGIKVTCEMGGKNPVVVLDDADVELAAAGILQGAFGSTGQRCTATSRVVATPRIAPNLPEPLVRGAGPLKVGEAADPPDRWGPAVDERHR